MNEKSNRQDILKLLKRFGIKADEVIMAHLDKCGKDLDEFRLRITLEDTSDYDEPSRKMEPVVIDGHVQL